MSVEVSAFERDEGRQLVVHLVNYQPEVGRELAHSRHQVQEILPVQDLELTVRVDGSVTAVHLQPGGTPLSYEQSGGELKVRVDRLDCHGMVVVDLG